MCQPHGFMQADSQKGGLTCWLHDGYMMASYRPARPQASRIHALTCHLRAPQLYLLWSCDCAASIGRILGHLHACCCHRCTQSTLRALGAVAACCKWCCCPHVRGAAACVVWWPRPGQWRASSHSSHLFPSRSGSSPLAGGSHRGSHCPGLLVGRASRRGPSKVWISGGSQSLDLDTGLLSSLSPARCCKTHPIPAIAVALE
jgi:hypothetical protein